MKVDIAEGETTFIYWGEHRSESDQSICNGRNFAENTLRLQRTTEGIKVTCEKCRRTGEHD